MERLMVRPRPDWQKRFEELGFTFHSMDDLYWREGVCYRFSCEEIDCLEDVTNELNVMCLQAVEYVIEKDLFGRLRIPEKGAELVRSSWNKQDLSIYGRLDLCYDGRSEPKLLEFNADTPTSLYESSVAQWVWLEENWPNSGRDQFNSIHERLLDAFTAVKQRMPLISTMHFTCVKDNEEDLVTTEYLRDVAIQAGISTKHIFIEDIGYADGSFWDLEDEKIAFLFKLYPWEWLLAEEFGQYLTDEIAIFFEPAWKMVLSNKGILPILWEMFPGHKNLLPAFFEEGRLNGPYVKKPLYSREGANITLVLENGSMATNGSYGSEGHVYQQAHLLPDFDGYYAVIGSWVVNGVACGIGIREDVSPITKNTSAFVPHYFE